MADATKKLLRRIQGTVYKKQRRKIESLKGKTVMRNGVKYVVVAINSKLAVLSAAGTPPDQLQTMSTKAFLGKKVAVVE